MKLDESTAYCHCPGQEQQTNQIYDRWFTPIYYNLLETSISTSNLMLGIKRVAIAQTIMSITLHKQKNSPQQPNKQDIRGVLVIVYPGVRVLKIKLKVSTKLDLAGYKS